MADTRTSPNRRAASNMTASRLPSARERRPALAALAVLLIVGGAFASGFLALQAGNRDDYLRVRADVPQGAELTEADLESVSLPEDMDGVILADDMDQVVGLHTVTNLVEGTILTDNMVTEDSGIEQGEAHVTFGVPASSVAPDVDTGATVEVIAVPDDEGDPTSYPATVLTVDRAEDDSIGGGGGDSTVQVTVLMDADDGIALQPAINDERVGLQVVAPPPAENDDNGGE